jgi:hypothetical protein
VGAAAELLGPLSILDYQVIVPIMAATADQHHLRCVVARVVVEQPVALPVALLEQPLLVLAVVRAANKEDPSMVFAILEVLAVMVAMVAPRQVVAVVNLEVHLLPYITLLLIAPI